MAKINIVFNNINYLIDESFLAAAVAELQTHLSAAMSGSGANITLDGVSYGVDSTKLATATTAFVNHLGTVTGTGYKVKVDGVEYNVASDKMSGAVTELETVLGGLLSEDGGHDGNQLQKNQYGFYYHVPYTCVFPDGSVDRYVFCDDGDGWCAGTQYNLDELSEESEENEWFNGNTYYFEYNEVNNSLHEGEGKYDFVFSTDGGSFTIVFDGEEFVYTASTTETEHGVFYGSEYMNDNGDTMIFDESEVKMYDLSGNLLFVNNIEYGDNGHAVWKVDNGDLLATFDMSGNILYSNGTRFVRK